MESRVGKVQGVRTKRKKTQTESVQSDDGTTLQANSISTQNEDEDENESRDSNRVALDNFASPKPHLPGSEDQGALQPWSPGSWSWNNDLFSLDGSIPSMFSAETVVSGSSEAPSTQLSSSIRPSSSQTGLTSVDCENMGILAPSSSIQSFATPVSITSMSRQPTLIGAALPQPAEVLSAQKQAALAMRDSKCILALANMVITLENYIMSNLKVLDLVISSVRSVAEEMRKILQYQRESRNDCCIFLSTTIMYQVIALLEAGANDILEKEGAGQGQIGTGDEILDFTPKIGLGALSTFNVEEQRAMRVNVLRRECQNMEEVLSQLIALAKIGPDAAVPLTPAEMEDKTKCFTGLQNRLKELISRANLAL